MFDSVVIKWIRKIQIICLKLKGKTFTWLRMISNGHGMLDGGNPWSGVMDSQAVVGAPVGFAATSIPLNVIAINRQQKRDITDEGIRNYGYRQCLFVCKLQLASTVSHWEALVLILCFFQALNYLAPNPKSPAISVIYETATVYQVILLQQTDSKHDAARATAAQSRSFQWRNAWLQCCWLMEHNIFCLINLFVLFLSFSLRLKFKRDGDVRHVWKVKRDGEEIFVLYCALPFGMLYEKRVNISCQLLTDIHYLLSGKMGEFWMSLPYEILAYTSAIKCSFNRLSWLVQRCVYMHCRAWMIYQWKRHKKNRTKTKMKGKDNETVCWLTNWYVFFFRLCCDWLQHRV